MNILVTSSREHIQYYAVMLESLYVSNPDEKIAVYMILDRASGADIGPLEKQAERYQNKIIPIRVDESRFDKFPKVSARWPRLLYYKLLAAELLPPELDRVLLLESDMIITKSLKPLYEMPFDGNSIIACRNMIEYWGNIGKNHPLLKAYLGIPEEYDLFGGGVQVLNLEKLRGDHIGFEKVYRLAEKYKFDWGSPEESLFWALFYNSRKAADPFSYYLMPIYWQAQKGPIEDRQSAYGTVIHYSLCSKPWDGYVLDTECALDRIWWDHAKNTEFYPVIKERFDRRMRDREDCKEIKKVFENVDVYYQTVIRWKFTQDATDKSPIREYCLKNGYKRVAVYGINPLQILLCNELKNSDVSVSYLVDSYESRQMGDYSIKRAADCSFNDVDAIIITAFLHYDVLKKNASHAPCPVLSLQAILDELLPESFQEFAR